MARKDPLAHLSRHVGTLPDGLLREVLGRLPAELPRLEALALDPRGLAGEAPETVAARHAVNVLARWPDPRALPILLAVFDRAESEEIPVFVGVVHALGRRAADLVEELMARARGPRGPAAIEVLVVGGVDVPRLVPLVAQELDRDPANGLILATALGDPALAGVVRARLDAILAKRELSQEDTDAVLPLAQALAAMGSLDDAYGARLVARLEDEKAQKRATLEALNERRAALAAWRRG